MSLIKLKAGEKPPKSKYKGVHCVKLPRGQYLLWRTQLTIKGKTESSRHATEIEAAKRYDMYLIRAGREPVNIIKKKEWNYKEKDFAEYLKKELE